MADSLTPAEVKEFLEGALQMQNPLVKLQEDRVAFLDDVIYAFQERIPFQSVTAIATPRSERRRLTFEEIKTNILTRLGGLCFESNYFMKVLLERLGYDAHHVGFDVNGKPNNHLAIVVRSLSRPGDTYLVDVSCGYWMPGSIPLDFERESPVYCASSLPHKFVWGADGTVRWMHGVHGDVFQSATADPVDGWRVFTMSRLEPRAIEFFEGTMENIRTVESGPEALTPLLLTLRAMIFINGKMFAIKDATVLEEDETGKVHKKRLSSQEEMLELFAIHFPQIPRETVLQALQTLGLTFQV